MCGLQVQLEDFGTIIFSGDACYTAVNYGPPVRPCGFVDNMGIYISSIEKVRKLAKETKAFVVFGHDKEQFQNLKHAPEYYE
jgi:glyoxylase-like metal-dependent hydrolase (beta-lactamase superfamily II)